MVSGFVGGLAGGAVVNIAIRAIDQYSNTFNNATSSVDKFNNIVKRLATAGAIAGGMLTGIARAGIDMETAMAGVRKTTGMSASEISNLKDELLEMTNQMPITATEMANIAEVAGQLGIQGSANIKQFAETAAKMAIATEMTAEEAAVSLAKISNAFGLPITQAENLASVINELSNTTAATSREISSALVRVAGSAASLGMSTDVVSGLVATLISAGEPAERAGTKLRSAFDSVIKNIDKVEGILPGFAQKLKTDANGAILELIDTLNKIQDPIKRQQVAMEIFGTVGASAINKLSNSLPDMTKNLKTSSTQFKKATSLQDEYNIASETTENALKTLKGQWENLKITLADAVLPVLKALLEPIGKIITAFSESPQWVKILIVGFLGLVTVLGVLAVAIWAVNAAVGQLAFLLSPITLIVLLIIGVIMGLIYVIKHWGEMISWFGELFRTIFQGIKDFFVLVWEGIKAVFVTVWNFIKNIFQKATLVGIIIKNWTRIKDFFRDTWESIKGFFQNAWEFIKSIPQKIIDAFKGIGQTIRGFFENMIPDGVIDFIDGAKKFFGGLFGRGGSSSVNDAIIKPDGSIIRTNPNDTLIATQNPDALGGRGGGIVINIENVNGLDPDEVAKALQSTLNDMIRI